MRPIRTAARPISLFTRSPGAFLVADSYAISWLSMRLGLTGRKPIRVIILAFWSAVLLPGLVSLALSIFCAVWQINHTPLWLEHLHWLANQANPAPLFALLWAIPSLTADLIVLAVGRFNLLSRFREALLEPRGTFRPAPAAR